MIPSIVDMLAYRRPAGSVTEAIFIETFIACLPGAYQDTIGNWIVITDPASTILFSCHTDTVHHDPGMQTLHVRDGMVSLSNKAKRKHSNCLGADDTAGCWILINMIRANVPGTYVFHYGEERGCIGSEALARMHPNWLNRFTHAIAFDRRGTTDVITHQNGSRCASDLFAYDLAERLKAAGLDGYAPEHGVYTDTASYVDLVSECTNLSVGYYREHSAAEVLSIDHLAKLRDALLRMNWADLVIARDPTVPDPDDWGSWRWRGYGLSSRWHDDEPADLGDDGVIVLCMSCGNTFDLAEHSCPDCGENDPDRLDPIVDDQAARDTPYLDRVYGEVQAEITEQIARWRDKRGEK